MVSDTMADHQGKPIRDSICPTHALEPKSSNPALQPAIAFRTLVQTRRGNGESDQENDMQQPLKVGQMMVGNVVFTSLGLVLMQHTHSLASLEALVLSITNGRTLPKDQMRERLSCLIPYDESGKALLDQIAAMNTEEGKMLRALWRELYNNYKVEKLTPHLRAQRYYPAKNPPQRQQARNATLLNSEERIKGYKSKSGFGTSSSAAGRL